MMPKSEKVIVIIILCRIFYVSDLITHIHLSFRPHIELCYYGYLSFYFADNVLRITIRFNEFFLLLANLCGAKLSLNG